MSTAALALRATSDGTAFDVRVVPGASRCAVLRDAEGGLRVRVDAPPVDGAANERLVRYLAKDVFGVAKGSIRIVRGDRGRTKTIEVSLSIEETRRALEEALR